MTAVVFSRSLRSLGVDRFARGLWVIAGSAVLLAAWAVWFVSTPLAVYERSDDARIEVIGTAHAVYSELDGIVAAVLGEVGREVEAGTPLLVLETGDAERRQRELRAQRAAAESKLPAVKREIEALQAAMAEGLAAAEAGEREARLAHAQALSASRYAEAELARLRGLGSMASAVELLRAEGAAEQARLHAEAAAVAIDRIGADAAAQRTEREARLAALERERAALEGEIAVASAKIATLEHEIARHTIEAPVAGRLGETAALRPGTFVAAGERVATIVPDGGLRVVASLPPAAAVGRIRPGQPARVQVHGFPWGQYGTVAGEVARVSSEVRDGRIRVECTLAREAVEATTIPLQHGMPASVEIEVERVPPAVLTLRLAGRRDAQPPGSGQHDAVSGGWNAP